MDPPAREPMLMKSAILDFINSQYPSSMDMGQNFSPAFFDATESYSTSSSLGVNMPVFHTHNP